MRCELSKYEAHQFSTTDMYIVYNVAPSIEIRGEGGRVTPDGGRK